MLISPTQLSPSSFAPPHSPHGMFCLSACFGSARNSKLFPPVNSVILTGLTNVDDCVSNTNALTVGLSRNAVACRTVMVSSIVLGVGQASSFRSCYRILHQNYSTVPWNTYDIAQVVTCLISSDES